MFKAAVRVKNVIYFCFVCNTYVQVGIGIGNIICVVYVPYTHFLTNRLVQVFVE